MSGLFSLVIVGTSPGVFLRVVRWCDLFVRMRFLFAVGSLVFIIGGACDTRCIGGSMGGCVLVTLTLCSAGFCVVSFINSSSCFRRCLIIAFPFGVSLTFVAVVSNSSVSARRCSLGLRLGTWQCWGNSSADPEMRYALVSGT